jgi:hypothetical protein
MYLTPPTFNSGEERRSGEQRRANSWITGNTAQFGANTASHPKSLVMYPPEVGYSSGQPPPDDVSALRGALVDAHNQRMVDPTGGSSYLEGITVSCRINNMNSTSPCNRDQNGNIADDGCVPANMNDPTNEYYCPNCAADRKRALGSVTNGDTAVNIDELNGYATFRPNAARGGEAAMTIQAETNALVGLTCTATNAQSLSLTTETQVQMRNCDLGYRKPKTGVGDCAPCGRNTYSRQLGGTECYDCPAGGVCEGVETDVNNREIKRGYNAWPAAGYWEIYIPENSPKKCWEYQRSLVAAVPSDPTNLDRVQDRICGKYVAETPPTFYKCQRKEWCPGGGYNVSTVVDLGLNRPVNMGMCRPGHTGPMCSLCETNPPYNFQSGYCVPCQSEDGSFFDMYGKLMILVTIAFIVIVLLAFKAYQKYMQKLASAEAEKAADERPKVLWDPDANLADPEKEKVDDSGHIPVKRIRQLASGAPVSTNDMQAYKFEGTSEKEAKKGTNTPRATNRIYAIFKHMTGGVNQLGKDNFIKGTGAKMAPFFMHLLGIPEDSKILKSNFRNKWINLERTLGAEKTVQILDRLEELILRSTGGAAPDILKVKVHQMSVSRQEDLVQRAIQIREGGRRHTRSRKAGLGAIQDIAIADQVAGGPGITGVVENLGSPGGGGGGPSSSDSLITSLMETGSKLGKDALDLVEDEGFVMRELVADAGREAAGALGSLGREGIFDYITDIEGDTDGSEVVVDAASGLAAGLTSDDASSVWDCLDCCGSITGEISGAIEGAQNFGLEGLVALSEEFSVLASKLKAPFKILASHLQILSSLEVTLEIPWPDIFTNFTMSLSFINLEMFEILPAGCIATFNFYHKFLGTISFPVMCTAALIVFVKWTMSSVRDRGNTEAARKAKGNGFMAFFLFTYLIYPGVSAEILRMFACEKIAKEMYLTADLTLKCYTSEYTMYFLMALGAVLVYPIGIPLFYGVILFQRRHKFHLEETQYTYGFLYDQYEYDKWYYEIVELLRKLALTGTVTFFFEGSISQISTALLISCIFLMIHIHLQAYYYNDDDTLQLAAMGTATMTLFGGILLRASEDSECAASQAQGQTEVGTEFMGFLLVAIQVLVIAISFYCVIFKKLVPQFREFSHRLKKMQVIIKQHDSAKAMPGHLLEEAAKIQLEVEMASRYGIRFANDDAKDLVEMKEIVAEFDEINNAFSVESPRMGPKVLHDSVDRSGLERVESIDRMHTPRDQEFAPMEDLMPYQKLGVDAQLSRLKNRATVFNAGQTTDHAMWEPEAVVVAHRVDESRDTLPEAFAEVVSFVPEGFRAFVAPPSLMNTSDTSSARPPPPPPPPGPPNPESGQEGSGSGAGVGMA